MDVCGIDLVLGRAVGVGRYARHACDVGLGVLKITCGCEGGGEESEENRGFGEVHCEEFLVIEIQTDESVKFKERADANISNQSERGYGYL